ncbi:ankyrin, partial [Choiromyces venosus 120613-1]
PLHWAVYVGDRIMLRSLLDDERVDVNIHSSDDETALHVAIQFVNGIAVHMLLADPKIQVQDNGISILHFAVFCGNRSMVQLLLESNKMDVNFEITNGVTPLILAVFLRDAHIIRILLRCENIEVGAVNSEGNTA